MCSTKRSRSISIASTWRFASSQYALTPRLAHLLAQPYLLVTRVDAVLVVKQGGDAGWIHGRDCGWTKDKRAQGKDKTEESEQESARRIKTFHSLSGLCHMNSLDLHPCSQNHIHFRETVNLVCSSVKSQGTSAHSPSATHYPWGSAVPSGHRVLWYSAPSQDAWILFWHRQRNKRKCIPTAERFLSEIFMQTH